MRVKKIIAGIVLTVMVMENSLTSLAAPMTNTAVITEAVTGTEEEETESVPELAGEETSSGEEAENEESTANEIPSEEECVSSETQSVERGTVEEISVQEAVSEQETDEETVMVTEEETLAERTTETVLDNVAAEGETEEAELDYILGRPMTEAEMAAQEALVPEYMPQLELMPMEGMSDNGAGLNQLNLFNSSSLPEKYDSRDNDIITSVKDQNPWGTCWSFATMALMESSWFQQFNETVDLSERHLTYFMKHTGYDPLGNASEDTIVSYSDSYYLESGGNLYKSAVKMMNWHGAAEEEDYPYSKTVPEAIASENAQDIIAYPKNVFFIPTENDTQEDKVNKVKQLIQTYGCVEWSYYHHDNFLNKSTAAYYLNSSAYGTNHSITIVGWDDTYSKNNFNSSMQPENDGAWIVKNSWGESFGDNGYMYLSYEDQSLGCGNPVAVIVAGDAQDYDNNYFYGNIVSNSQISPRQSIANVYTINGDTAKQKIKAVSFMAAGESQDYAIQLYKNPDMTDGIVTNPASGTALLTEEVTGQIGYTGLYTVDIPEITVELDDRISVVITFDSAGWVYCTSSTTTTSGGETVLTETNVTAEGESFSNSSQAANSWVDGADSGRSFLINLLTENVSEIITTPALTYTLDSPADFTDTIDCNLKWVKCSNVLGYELYRAESADGTYEKIADISASNRTYQDSIALADREKTFYYKLAALYENDVLEESEIIAVDCSSIQLLPEIDFKQYMDFVLLGWEEMQGAEGYIIEKKTADESEYTQLAEVKSGDDLICKDENVSLYESVYDYRIRAYTTDGVYSDWKEWNTTDAFSLTQYGSSQITLKWKKVNDSTYFRLRMGNYNWSMGNYSSVRIDDVNPMGDAKKYYMEMYSSQEAYDNGELPVYVTPYIYYYSVPEALQNLEAAWDGTKASFTWDATTTADIIAIYRSRDAEDRGEAVYAQVEGTATSYEDLTFVDNGTYYYWFEPQKANSLGEMVAGESVSVQVEIEIDDSIEPVELLSVTEKTESSVEITWEKHNLAEGYSVYRKGANDTGYEKIASITDAEQLSYIDETVTIGKIYEYKVVVIVGNVESGLNLAESMQVQTKPAQPVLINTNMMSIEIKNNQYLEYTAVETGTEASLGNYVSGTEDTVLISDLAPNTSYLVYARTKSSVTGTDSIYSEALTAITKAADGISITLEDYILAKEETVKIQTVIVSGEEEENYTGDIEWSATGKEGQECSVVVQNKTAIVSGSDGKEILQIADGNLMVSALSEVKELKLTGTVSEIADTDLSDEINITIEVPLESLEIKVESVNDTAVDSLEGTEIGDTAVLYAEKEPFNADATLLQWQSQDEAVAVVTPDSSDSSRAEMEIKGPGTTTIHVQTEDGTVKAQLEVSTVLKTVVMTSAAEKTPDSIEIKWEKHNQAESYKLYRKAGNQGTYSLLTTIMDKEQTVYEDTDILIGKTYSYKVTAVYKETESDFETTIEVSAKTAPSEATVAEDGITYDSVTINSIVGMEYAIALPGVDKTTLTYIKAQGDTLTFRGLEPNTSYVIYVRTDSSVTEEAAVYGPALKISTMIKAELVLSIKDTVLSKGNKLPFSYTITPENLHYQDSIVWLAADTEGHAYEVITVGTDTIVIKGNDGKEICRISNGYFYATGESAQKDVYITVKRGSLEADFHVKIHVPVTDLQMKVVSVNEDTSVTTLESFAIGQKAQLELSVLPVNAEETILWSSSNEKVASVHVSEADETKAEITANGTGSCVIMATSSDGVKTSMTVTVNRIAPLYVIWISDMADLSGTTVVKDSLTGEYISESLEKQPIYSLNDTMASHVTLVSYVLENENGGAIRKAEPADGIVYRSSDTTVASVTRDGVVTAVGSGEADIIVYESKGNGIFGSCRVLVTMQGADVPQADGNPVDKSVKLSAVTKNLNLENFALDEKSSAQVQIKDQYGKIYSSEEMKLFTFTSANPSVCMVDETGVVRPNPNYTGKTTSVKITAALKEDKAKRKVVFTVKVLAEKQIDRMLLECVSVSGDAAITDTVIAETFTKGKEITFAVKAYDSKGNLIENPKLKFTMSDTKVAKAKDNKDGTVTVTLVKAGRSNLVVTGNDVWKNTASMQIVAVDTKPYLSKTTLTLNTKIASLQQNGWSWKTSEDIMVRFPDEVLAGNLEIIGASIGKNALTGTELTNLAIVENEDGTWHIAVKENYAANLAKNTELTVNMQAEVENTLLDKEVTEQFTVTVKIISQEAKITVSEAKSINRFYKDKDETLLILKASSIITAAEVVDNECFTVSELKRGQWYLKFSDPNGTYNAKKTNITLRLTAQGYEPVEKKLTVQTPYKAPALNQQNIPLVHLGNDQMHRAEIVLYDKTVKQELTGYEIKAFTSSKLEEGVLSGSGFYVQLKDGAVFKNNEKVTAQVGVQAENWAAPVTMKVTVKVSTKAPKLVMSSAKVTLNKQAATEKVTVALSPDQKNIELLPCSEWNLQMYDIVGKEWISVGKGFGSDWLALDYDMSSNKVSLGIQNRKTVAEGSYKFRISNILEGFETVYKDFTVKVIDVKPTVSVTIKGKQDLINREAGSLVGTMKFKNAVSSKATDVVILSDEGTGVNTVFEAELLSNGKFTIRFTEAGMQDASLKKQKVTLPVAVTMENGTIVHGSIRFSLTQSNPKVKIPAMQTIYKSMKGLTKEYDFASGLAAGVMLDKIDVVSVPKGFTAVYKEGNVVVTLNDRGIKAGTYSIKVKLYFEGAAEGTKPVSKTVKVKVME